METLKKIFYTFRCPNCDGLEFLTRNENVHLQLKSCLKCNVEMMEVGRTEKANRSEKRSSIIFKLNKI